MLTSAQTFLVQFPQSAFLAQAYEIAARASFDLRQYGPGLDYARHSLALLPENPLLLVPVADVEAQQHLNEAAVSHAEEALQDLERFGGGKADAKQLLEASFRFLLEREPNTSILLRFKLGVINNYFPEYEREIARYLAG